MASYLIKKENKTNQIKSMEQSHGYTFNPKKKEGEKRYIDVNEVTVYDHSMIDTILTTKFNRTFAKLLAMVQQVLDDEEATTSQTQLCLDEIELVRQILLNKYDEFLNHEKEQLFLKKLKIVENELRVKQMFIKERTLFLQEQEELKHGRGR